MQPRRLHHKADPEECGAGVPPAHAESAPVAGGVDAEATGAVGTEIGPVRGPAAGGE